MPKDKDCMKVIPRIHKRNYENILMFGYVMGVTQLVPSVTIKSAIQRYMAFINVDEDSYNLESALATFTLMKREFVDAT